MPLLMQLAASCPETAENFVLLRQQERLFIHEFPERFS